MQRFLRQYRCLSLVCASIIALLGSVACSSTAPSFSVFNQRPKQGSGVAITLQTANHVHLLWSYQPSVADVAAITSTKGIVYIRYTTNTSSVGKGGSVENFNQSDLSGVVSVLDALDSQSGHRLWQFQALGELPDVAAGPLLVANTIYLAFTSHVCALNAQTGELRWCSAVIDRENNDEYILDGEMAYEHGSLFLGAYHTLVAIDALNGKRMWSTSVVMRSSHLVVSNDVVYVSAVGGPLVAFDARLGKPLWHTMLVPDTNAPNTYAPVPFAVNGVLYVLAGRILAAFQGKLGNILWRVMLPGEHNGESFPSVVVAPVGGTIYLFALEDSSATSQLVAYNLQTHQHVWSKQMAGPYGQALAVSSRVGYVASLQVDGNFSPQLRWHFWLSMIDLRSGQVVRQLQDNDPSFRVRQLVADDSHLYAAGSFPDVGQKQAIYALGN